MIRQATEDDLRSIVEMADRFYPHTKYASFADFNAPSCGVLTQTLLEVGVMLVAEVDGKVVGMIGLIITPFMFNFSVLTAHEVAWWVDPDFQGSRVGFNLLKTAEAVCKERGVRAIQMVLLPDSPSVVKSLYEKMGYVYSESSYTKVI